VTEAAIPSRGGFEANDTSLIESDRDSLCLTADLPEVSRACAWLMDRVAARALPETVGFAIRLCAEEALTNVVTHAFVPGAGGSGHAIDLCFAAEPDVATLTIEDDGIPFDPSTAPAPAPTADLVQVPVGGRGLLLMRGYAGRLTYERRDGRNHLTMVFPIERR
jgi:anti-sigma regulatory factor (Ser/Thr protein kinase)